MALSDSQTGRRSFWRRLRPQPPANPEPPSLTQTTFPTCHAHYPGGPDQVLVGWRVARSRAGFFPVRVAFPVIGAGRRPHPYFRGLLKLHTRYGLQSCSPTIRGLYREASPWPVSRLGRSQATKFNQQPPWVGPSPLVICAVEAHPITPDIARGPMSACPLLRATARWTERGCNPKLVTTDCGSPPGEPDPALSLETQLAILLQSVSRRT